MKKCLSKIYWRGKWKDVKRMFFLLLPKATKHGTFQRPPNIGTFHWSPSKMFPHWPSNMEHSKATKLGTFHWPPSWGPPSPLSFPFYLKAWIWIICLSFFKRDFWKLLPTTFLRKKKVMSLNRRWKKGNYIGS